MRTNLALSQCPLFSLQSLITAGLFIIVCLSWGTTWLGIKIAVETLPPLSAAGLRFLIAFPLFLLFALSRRESILFPKSKLWFFIFITLGYFTIPYYLLNFGETHVSSGLTALLFSSMPVLILIFSATFLAERIYLSQITGIAIGIWSLYMILRSQGLDLGHGDFIGVLAILMAAVMHALCYVITKKHSQNISVIAYNTLPIGLAGALLFAAGWYLEKPNLDGVSARSWFALLYLGLVASVGGFIVYFFLLKRLNPVILSFVFIIFPVVAVVLGARYEGVPLSSELVSYSTILLFSFGITKAPIENLIRKKQQQKGTKNDCIASRNAGRNL